MSTTAITASKARSGFYRLIDEVAEHHIPVKISGPRNNAVLIGEDDWRSIQESLHLLSIPRMRESIRKGLKEPKANLSKNPGFRVWSQNK